MKGQSASCIPARSELMERYLHEHMVRQIVAVRAWKKTRACVKLYEKEIRAGAAAWKTAMCCEAYIGINGLGKEREGDGKTPAGDFGIVTAFGICGNPGTVLPYVKVGENTVCCEEGAFYNQIIDTEKFPGPCAKGERMIEYSPEYRYGIFLDYNAERTPGKGSAIFIHCRGAKPYTNGCIAVAERNMITILKTVDMGARFLVGVF